MKTPKTAALFALVALAMIAFAANSVLTRMALAPDLIAADRFSTIRMASACLTLWAILAFRGALRSPRPPRVWATAGALVLYVFGFSFAYERLDAGIGALLLFGCVQFTMIGWGLSRGERLSLWGWLGLAIALAGLALILTPSGAAAPDPLGAALMLAAGVGWGVYSLLGRAAGPPLPAAAWGFLLCAPVVLLADLAVDDAAAMTADGVALALASGVVASGLGYLIWFIALPHLPATRAATAQLSVPAIAAIGGALLIGEPITTLMLIATALTLGGIGLAIVKK